MSTPCASSLADIPARKFYGRSKGRPLGALRSEVLDTLLPVLTVRPDGLDTIDPATLFPAPLKQYWYEIGFGSGEHLSAVMRRHPDYGFIGAEPYINGMSAFLKDIQDEPKDNIRVLMDDAMLLARSFKTQTLDGIYILNPDPWPKKRHNKRRIVSTENLDVFARILKPGGQLILSTDVADLAEWMLTYTYNHPAFEWQAESANDWKNPPKDWVTTKYEVKQANHTSKKMAYLLFTRKACQNT